MNAHRLPTLVALLLQPEKWGALVPAKPIATRELLQAYSSRPPEQMSWCRGFLGTEPLVLDCDQRADEFVRCFQKQLSHWLNRLKETRSGGRPMETTRLTEAITQARLERIVTLETRFVSICLDALERWNQETHATVMWDLDETLIGSGARVRFLRPSSEAVLKYALRHLPALRHGILTSLSTEWVPAAATLIGAVLDLPTPFGDVEWRYSFRPALDLFEEFDWETVRSALRQVGFPDCRPGRFEQDWPFYVTEFSRVVSLHYLQRRGSNIKVIDNDLNACFDPMNTLENQVGEDARSWLRAVLGASCATGPHWWPQETEEWILERIGTTSS